MSETEPVRPKRKMWKPILLSLLGVVVVVGALGAIKASQIMAMIKSGENFSPPAIGVTTALVGQSQWARASPSIGTAVAMQEVTITPEVPGKVLSIGFESGQQVKQRAVLVTLDSSIERAQLQSEEAAFRLANLSFERTKKLLESGATTQVEFDQVVAQKAQTRAQVAALRATIAKKTLRAPFAGRLGIRSANLGEVLQPGTPVVTLQSLNPIYVDFRVPESVAAVIQPGHDVEVRGEGLGDSLRGVVDTIDTRIDPATRNVRVRAQVANDSELIRPGMYLDVSVIAPGKRDVLLVPNTAVLYAPYGDSVYVVDEQGGKKVASQVFVRLGERRGDFVAVLDGLKGGQTVVSTGAFKLQNGAEVAIDQETKPPSPRLKPDPENQ